MPRAAVVTFRDCPFCKRQFSPYNKRQRTCRSRECLHQANHEYWAKSRKKKSESGYQYRYHRDYYNKVKLRQRFIEMRRAWGRTSRERHPEKYKLWGQNYRVRTRLEAMLRISSDLRCTQCGCDYFPFLEINHLNGGGYDERLLKLDNFSLYRKIIVGEIPSDFFDIRCKLCNWMYYFGSAYPEIKDRYRIVWSEVIEIGRS